jgi:hypothetical protein
MLGCDLVAYPALERACRLLGKWDGARRSPCTGRVESRCNLAELRGEVGEGDCAIRIDIDGETEVIQLHVGGHLALLPIAQVEMPEPVTDAALETLLGVAEIALGFLVLGVQRQRVPKAPQCLDIVLRLVMANPLLER